MTDTSEAFAGPGRVEHDNVKPLRAKQSIRGSLDELRAELRDLKRLMQTRLDEIERQL